MSQDQWTAVDRYLADLFVPHDAPLEAVLAASAAAGLPAIQVSPNVGKLLMLLARRTPLVHHFLAAGGNSQTENRPRSARTRSAHRKAASACLRRA